MRASWLPQEMPALRIMREVYMVALEDDYDCLWAERDRCGTWKKENNKENNDGRRNERHDYKS